MIDMIQQVIVQKPRTVNVSTMCCGLGIHPSGTWVTSTLGSQKKLDADWQTRQNGTLDLFGVWNLVLPSTMLIYRRRGSKFFKIPIFFTIFQDSSSWNLPADF